MNAIRLDHLLLALTLAAVPTQARSTLSQSTQEPWLTDASAANARADERGLDVLIVFTGSDWCAPCKRLHDELLATDEFVAATADRFVLLELDYPKHTEQPAPLAEQNARMLRRYSVSAYPTVVLTDASGQPYGVITGYRGETLDVFLRTIEALRSKRVERDRLFDEAESAADLERARLLREALSTLGEVSAFYSRQLDEIHRIEAAMGLSAQERAQRYLQDRTVAAYDTTQDREGLRANWGGLRAEERDRIDQEILAREITDLIAGVDLLHADVDSPEFQSAMLHLFALRYRANTWPMGAPGNRALIGLSRWADHERDVELFATCIDELRTVRSGLGGNEAFFAWYGRRLEQLRRDEPRPAFTEAFLGRLNGGAAESSAPVPQDAAGPRRVR